MSKNIAKIDDHQPYSKNDDIIIKYFLFYRTPQNIYGCCVGYSWNASIGYCVGMSVSA